MELVDTLDLGFNQTVVLKILLKCGCGGPDSYRDGRHARCESINLMRAWWSPKCREVDTLKKQPNNAGVVELVDTLDLGSSASRCEGSSPFTRTKAGEKSSAFLS